LAYVFDNRIKDFSGNFVADFWSIASWQNIGCWVERKRSFVELFIVNVLLDSPLTKLWRKPLRFSIEKGVFIAANQLDMVQILSKFFYLWMFSPYVFFFILNDFFHLSYFDR
jgi:hypothetical protein